MISCIFLQHHVSYGKYFGENETHQPCQKVEKIFTGSTYKLLSTITVTSDVNMSYYKNKSTFIKYCLTKWISKQPRSFEIHLVKRYLVNFSGLVTLVGIVNTTVYKTGTIFHRSQAWQIVLNFNNASEL